MAKGMKDLTGDGGVLKKVLKAGVGPVVPEGGIVRGESFMLCCGQLPSSLLPFSPLQWLPGVLR